MKKKGSKKRTIDLRVEDSTANLFIECKSARPSQKALREITTNHKTKEDLGRFLEFIIQGYKTISDYDQGKYPEQKPTILQKFLLIVTMEDWRFEIFSLYFNVEEELKNKLKEHSLPIEYLVKYPYFTCSAYGYQYLLEILKTENIYDVLAKKRNNPEYNKWGLEEYLRDAYSAIFAQTNPSKGNTFEKIVANVLKNP